METKKMFATLAILIIALSIAGYAYAHWEKIVTIDGEINTGTFDLIILSAADDDDPTKPDPGKDKNVADTVIEIDPNDPERAIVTITNAYPSYYVYVHITVRNVGTIPAKLKEIRTTAPPCINVTGWNGIGEQLEPYPTWPYQGDYSGYIHVEQCANQTQTYIFTIEFVFWNWNEVP